MKCVAFIVMLMSLYSCTLQEPKAYDLADIKFPGENARSAVKKHNIAVSYFYADSSFTNGKYYHFKRFCDSSITFRYDSNGNQTNDIDGYCQYNSINRLVFSNVGRCLSSTNYYVYLFNTKEQLLYQLAYDKPYSYEPPGINQWGQRTGIIRLDTIKYRFDHTGKITAVMSNGFPTYEFKYNKDGKLLSQGWSSESEGSEKKFFEKKYYYTQNKRDSILTIHKMHNDSVYIERDYFDENELLCRSSAVPEALPLL